MQGTMGYRRKSRELVLQMLFHLDLNKDQGDWRERFWQIHPAPKEVRSFADLLLDGVLAHQEEIDKMIRKHAQHWTLDRMSIVDRNILRSAIYEMLYLADVPIHVAINEAIEVAKRFSDDQSGAFINGILDHLMREESLARRSV